MNIKENVKSGKLSHLLAGSDVISFLQVVLFTLLTAVAAQITIPVKPVPFTFQTTLVVLSGAFLGAKKGAYSQFLYLMLGCMGLPVFAQIPDNSLGIARLFGPTGGYLLAFPVGAMLAGYLTGKINFTNSALRFGGIFLSLLAGEAFIILTGALYLGAVYLKNMQEALIAGAAVFVVWTVAKAVIGTGILVGLNKGLSRFKK